MRVNVSNNGVHKGSQYKSINRVDAKPVVIDTDQLAEQLLTEPKKTTRKEAIQEFQSLVAQLPRSVTRLISDFSENELSQVFSILMDNYQAHDATKELSNFFLRNGIFDKKDVRLFKTIRQLITNRDDAFSALSDRSIELENDFCQDTYGKIVQSPGIFRTIEREKLVIPALRSILSRQFQEDRLLERTLLDIGSWDGSIPIALKEHFRSIYAVEPSQVRFESLQRKLSRFSKRDRQLGDFTEMTAINQDMMSLTQHAATLPYRLDAVLMSHVLYFAKFEQDEFILKWGASKLSQDGILLLVLNDTTPDIGTRAHLRRVVNGREANPNPYRMAEYLNRLGTEVEVSHLELTFRASSENGLEVIKDIARYFLTTSKGRTEGINEYTEKHIRDHLGSNKHVFRHRIAIISARKGKEVIDAPDLSQIDDLSQIHTPHRRYHSSGNKTTLLRNSGYMRSIKNNGTTTQTRKNSSAKNPKSGPKRKKVTELIIPKKPSLKIKEDLLESPSVKFRKAYAEIVKPIVDIHISRFPEDDFVGIVDRSRIALLKTLCQNSDHKIDSVNKIKVQIGRAIWGRATSELSIQFSDLLSMDWPLIAKNLVIIEDGPSLELIKKLELDSERLKKIFFLAFVCFEEYSDIAERLSVEESEVENNVAEIINCIGIEGSTSETLVPFKKTSRKQDLVREEATTKQFNQEVETPIIILPNYRPRERTVLINSHHVREYQKLVSIVESRMFSHPLYIYKVAKSLLDVLNSCSAQIGEYVVLRPGENSSQFIDCFSDHQYSLEWFIAEVDKSLSEDSFSYENNVAVFTEATSTFGTIQFRPSFLCKLWDGSIVSVGEKEQKLWAQFVTNVEELPSLEEINLQRRNIDSMKKKTVDQTYDLLLLNPEFPKSFDERELKNNMMELLDRYSVNSSDTFDMFVLKEITKSDNVELNTIG